MGRWLCRASGRPLAVGCNYWRIEPRFGSNVAVLAEHDLCWVRDGYGNNWVTGDFLVTR